MRDTPAFPIPRNHDSGDAIYTQGDGMSLLDYFAAKSLHGAIASGWAFKAEQHIARDKDAAFDGLAADCYDMAAAMLRARAARDAAKETR